MFWNKKDESHWFDFDDIEIYPSKKRVFLNQENFNALSEKIDLILEYLKLDYVPEQYKTEPAKLTEQKVWNMGECLSKIAEYSAQHYTNTVVAARKKKLDALPKKKRGRPRKGTEVFTEVIHPGSMGKKKEK
jgi:hypothetical protein